MERGLVCCGPSAYFSPYDRDSLFCLILIIILGFCVSLFKKRLLPPVMEALLTLSLLLGVILNALIGYHLGVIGLVGNLPIGLLFLAHLVKHQRELNRLVREDYFDDSGFITQLAGKLLKAQVFIKYPVLLVLALPFLILFSLFLILFCQKPDALITAFTETYKMGFSQLDHLCDNVNCGDHYLCSGAAHGHAKVVRPIRYGIRRNSLIICNRQLLIANAFEDWVQRKTPRVHLCIRKFYDRLGDHIHDNHTIYQNKYLSDIINIIMKPLEWSFIFLLYCVEVRPEDRIAQQYV